MCMLLAAPSDQQTYSWLVGSEATELSVKIVYKIHVVQLQYFFSFFVTQLKLYSWQGVP